MSNQFPKLYTYSQAAEILTISVATLRRRVMLGEIPHKKIGRSVRFSEDDIDAIIRSVPGGVK